MKGLFLRLFSTVIALSMVIPGTFLISPAPAHAFGGLAENGTAAFMGIGVNPTKILHVSGTGPGTVPLFVRGTDSAGFIIERTPTNRWVFGVNENPALGYGFVLSTFPTGSGSSVARLLVTPAGNVGIGTVSPDTHTRLHVYNTDNTSGARAIYGETLGNDTYGVYGKSTGNGYGVLGTTGEFGSAVKGENSASGTSGYIAGPSWSVYGQHAGMKGGLAGTGGNGAYGETTNSGAAAIFGYYRGTGLSGAWGAGTAVYGRYSDNKTEGYLGGSEYGVYGRNDNNSSYGYLGGNDYGMYGRYGASGPWGYIGSSNYGVSGSYTNGNYGRLGTESAGIYAWGHSTGNTNTAIKAENGSGHEAKLCTTSWAVYGRAANSASYAGYFNGRVHVTDNLSVSDNLTVGTVASIGTTSPANSTLQVQGSLSTAFRLVSSADNITDADSVIAVDASEDEVVVTLPTATGCKGRTYTVKKVDDQATEVILNGSGAETIDGVAEYVLDDQWEMVTIVSDGSNWLIISWYSPPPPPPAP